MTDKQYRTIRKAESQLKELYLRTAPTLHLDLNTLANRVNDVIDKTVLIIPQYAVHGLHSYADGLKAAFEHTHLVRVSVTPIGKLEIRSKEYQAYIYEVTPMGFTDQNNPIETVYRNDYSKVYFASKENRQ